MATVISPSGFLKYGGIVLIVVSVVGFAGLTAGIEAFNLDNGENAVHGVLGIVALAVAFGLKNAQFQKWLVAAVAVLSTVAFLWSLTQPAGTGFASGAFAKPNAGFTNLENPADTVLHIVVAAWAYAAAFMKPSSA